MLQQQKITQSERGGHMHSHCVSERAAHLCWDSLCPLLLSYSLLYSWHK